MPKEELEKLKADAGTSDDSQASIDKELSVLYRQLLAKPAAQVDAEINKHFPTPVAPVSKSHGPVYGQMPPGQAMGYPQAYPQMGVPMGIPVAPRPGYPPQPTPQGWPPGFGPGGY